SPGPAGCTSTERGSGMVSESGDGATRYDLPCAGTGSAAPTKRTSAGARSREFPVSSGSGSAATAPAAIKQAPTDDLNNFVELGMVVRSEGFWRASRALSSPGGLRRKVGWWDQFEVRTGGCTGPCVGQSVDNPTGPCMKFRS